MRWLKLTLITLGGMLLLASLAIVVVVITFDEADYRDALIRLVERRTGARLTIKGSLHIAPSLTPELSAADIRLESGDPRYQLEIGKASLRLELLPLLTRRVVIHALSVQDTIIDWYPSPAAAQAKRRHRHGAVHLPAIDGTAFRNITLNYHRRGAAAPVQVHLAELEVDDIGEAGPARIKGAGDVSATPFQLQGELGAVAKLLAAQEPYPLSLALTVEKSRIAVTGTIGDPHDGKDIDVRVTASAAELSDLIKLLGTRVPPLGSLQAHATLRGDLGEPQLAELRAELSNAAGVSFQVQGSADNVLERTGLELAFSGELSDKAVIAWALPKVLAGLDSVTTSGVFGFADGLYLIRDFHVEGSDPAGLKVTLTGETRLTLSDPPFRELDVELKLSSPTTAAARPLLFDALPELGPVEGSGRYLAPSSDLAMNDIRLVFGPRDGLSVTVQGRIGRIPLDPDTPSSEIALDLAIASRTTRPVATALDLELPELGPVSFQGIFSGSSRDSSLNGIVLKTGDPTGLLLEAQGYLDFGAVGSEGWQDFVENVDIDVTFNSKTTRTLATLAAVALPELGPVQGALSVKGNGHALAIPKSHFRAGEQQSVLLEGSGTLQDIAPPPAFRLEGIDYKVAARAPSTTALASLTGHAIPDLGSLRASGHLTGSEKTLALHDVEISLAKGNALTLEAHGTVDNLTQQARLDLHTELSAQDLQTLGRPFDQSLPAEGPVKATGELRGDARQLHFKGDIALVKTRMLTDITAAFTGKRPRIDGSITIPDLNVSDLGIHSPPEADADAGKTPPEKKSPPDEKANVFSKAPLPFDALHALDLGLDVKIDEVTGTEALLDKVHATLSLEGGKLVIDPVRLDYQGGSVAAKASIDASAKPPHLSLSVNGDDLKLGPLVSQVRKEAPVSGFLTVGTDLKSRGQSAAEIAANLNGTAGFAAENAKVRKTDLELLTTDFLGWALTSVAAREKYVNVDCALFRVEVNRGIAQIATLLFDTPTTQVKGEGQVDLANETIDMVLNPKQKRKFWRSINPVTIKGPLAAPRVEAISARSLARNYGGLVLLPQVFIPAEALGHLWGLVAERGEKDSPCLKYAKPEDQAPAGSG